MKLYQMMNVMKELDANIMAIRKQMTQSTSYAVDPLRNTVQNMEDARDAVMRGTLASGANLDALMAKYRECVRGCLNPSYNGKPDVLAVPVPEPWEPKPEPVTVTAVHLIMYIDISESMFSHGGLGPNKRTRNLLQAFANEVKVRADQENVPTKVSLVGFADPTDKLGKNRPIFWETIVRQSSNVGDLADAIGTINWDKWADGLSTQEEGMTCISKTIDSLVDKSILNGKPTENVIILVSDERQRFAPHLNGHKNYPYTVTETAFRAQMKKHGIVNIFGMVPFNKGYNYDKYYRVTGIGTGKDWNRYLKPVFRSTKEFWDTSSMAQLQDWVRWTLNPGSFGS